jgi:sortase (surface protein transpeptidase)
MDCLRCLHCFGKSDEINQEINNKNNEKSDDKSDMKSDYKSEEKNNEKSEEKSDDKREDKNNIDTSSILDDIVVIETDKSELNFPIVLNETYCK